MMEAENDDGSSEWSDPEFDDENEEREKAVKRLNGQSAAAAAQTPLHSPDSHKDSMKKERNQGDDVFRNVAPYESVDDDLVVTHVGGRYSQDSNETEGVVLIANEDFQDCSESDKNCFGVFHVTVLEVKNLSCPVSSQVQAICYLLPWKGKVKLDPQSAVLRNNTVCLERNEEISMIHSYSDSNSPIPTLKLVLVLKLGWMEFNIATLEISCRNFIEKPNLLFHKWFRMSGNVLIHLEAEFEPLQVPTNSEETKNEASNKQMVIGNKRTLHLFQNVSYKVAPAICCNCQKSINWRPALQCELCKLDCCQDCRVQVDHSVPCGSQKAKKLVASAIQNKFTVDNMLNVLAPRDDPVSEAALSVGQEKVVQVASTEGIGKLRLRLLQAYVLVDSIPALSDPSEVIEKDSYRPGDYYVRVHGTKAIRTRTIQHSNGRPNLQETGELAFVVPHYGTEFKIELIDANVDKVLGTTFLSTQEVLQRQRDYLIEEKGAPIISFLYPRSFREPLDLLLALRTEMDNSLAYYSPPPTSGQTNKPGDIIGCIRVGACFEEDLGAMFGKKPYSCTGRPGEALNMSVIQLHLARISMIVEDLKQCLEQYNYIVGWEDPIVTFVSLVVFIQLCFWFNPAYIGSAPVFLLICTMVYLCYKRFHGKTKNIFIRREIEKNRKSEKGSVTYDIHRPIGILQVSIVKGRNIRSPELGLPGNVCCRMYWDPTKYMTESQKKRVNEVDQATCSMHDLGSTEFIYSKDPCWNRMQESANTKRLKMLVPNQLDALDQAAENGDAREIIVPFLQPFRKEGGISELEPWRNLSGALIVEVQFADVLNILPGSEYSIGRVVVPVAQLVENGKTGGWFNIVSDHEIGLLPLSMKQDGEKSEHAQLYLQARWSPPDNSSGIPIETEREASNAIQEELVRSALLAQHQKEKMSILVTSIGALNTVRGISANLQVVQNSLGAVLDIVESLIHLFDFTDPFKSLVVLCVLISVWFVLSVVSTRLLIMGAGLAQYAITFQSKFFQKKSAEESLLYRSQAEHATKDEESPVVTWILNAFRGIPTSEDLRRTYLWEALRVGGKETEIVSTAKRKARMKNLWRVDWYSTVRMFIHDSVTEIPTWHTVFAIIQGHRLLWWRSVGDFDNGSAPTGRLHLSGHAGLSSPSPLELREINKEELPLVVCIFGGGKRVTILAQSDEAKQELESVVERALTEKLD